MEKSEIDGRAVTVNEMLIVRFSVQLVPVTVIVKLPVTAVEATSTVRVELTEPLGGGVTRD